MAALLAAPQVILPVPWPVRDPAPVELQDAGRQALQEASIVGDEEQGPGEVLEEALEPINGVDVQMVGGLVQQQQVRLPHQGLGEQHPPLETARQGVERGVAIQAQARDDPLGALLDGPAAPLLEGLLDPRQTVQVFLAGVGPEPVGETVVLRHQVAQIPQPLGHQVEDARIRMAGDLLGEPGDAHPLPRTHGARIRRDLARDQPEQGGLARPVAPDETDPLPLLDRKGHALQQRGKAIGEANGFQREKGHGACGWSE